ncbi:hypothetical protein KW652_002969, partial [Listeria monocytogenes]|nr:hypothetical protein [Listeria monocytogenes]EHT0917591.1 hypothetical protein [Listeria monocytogenes]HAC2640899.1 hypothetical protein [Listeria monocytogenes]
MANKEDHMNMKNMSAKNMGNNESNMSHMDHDDMKMDHDMTETVLLQSSKMNNTSLTLAIVYAGIPNNIFISVQTENPKR